MAAGDSFTCTVTSTLGDKAALQTSASTFDAAIAGTVTSGTKALRSGAASFTVSTPSDASGTVTATGIVDGGAVGSVAVDVTNTAVLSEDTGTTATETTSAVLSATGFAGTTMALGAGVLLVAGATTVIVAARRNGPEDAQ
ncbi:hypothetical protein [Demequina silvatica]|uniref:hypothetical protein n=1 Tax=Demequina silvatica TaxID=1638988 RepID=UPI0007808C33|nr:hypothetical protein [Demequina silvatica]